METRKKALRATRRIGDTRRVGDAHRTVGELLLAFGVTPHLDGFDPILKGIRIRAEQNGPGSMLPE